MTQIVETDYLVVGAGATGMAFVDTLIAHSDADVIMVDRRHRPGGHWHDAYPFVRLHQAAACYGVESMKLGTDRIDSFGFNSGMYELSSAPELCSYFAGVMDNLLLPSGRVRFFPMSEFRESSPGAYTIVSLLTGEETNVRVRRSLVDATYVEPEIPARRRPAFEIDPDVALVPPNDLVNLGDSPAGFTVIGAGKTAMDVCTWLLENGVDPDRITWVRSRDGWYIDRAYTQPLDMVYTRVQYQAMWKQAAAEAESGIDMALRLEEAGLLLRLDGDVAAHAFRGATISRQEVAGLQTISRVIRTGRVQRLRGDGIDLTGGSFSQRRGEVYVDCTASGLRTIETQPVFGSGRITLQYVTPGFACWSAATIALIEATRDNLAHKNHLTSTVVYTGIVDDLLSFTHAFMTSGGRRNEEADLAEWSARTRLNPARGLPDRMSDPRLKAMVERADSWTEPAMRNIESRLGVPTSASGSFAPDTDQVAGSVRGVRY